MTDTREPLGRRRFLGASLGATTALLSGWRPAPASAAGANDRIRIGVIGTGGRARSLMRQLKDLPGAELEGSRLREREQVTAVTPALELGGDGELAQAPDVEAGVPLAASRALRRNDDDSADDRIRIEVAHARHLEALRSARGVKAVRQIGTVAAVELDAAPGYLSEIGRQLSAFSLANGVLLRPLGNVAYCLPPYCTTDDELGRVYDVIQRFLDGERASPAELPGTGGPVDD